MTKGKGMGLLALLLLVAMGRRRGGINWGGPWMWPVPTLYTPPSGFRPDGGLVMLGNARDYRAVVSSGFGSPRGTKDNPRSHAGLDIMYKRKHVADLVDVCPQGTKDPRDGFASTTGYFAPPATPIVAARPGRIWSVQKRGDGGGWSVVIDHGEPFATYYTHLNSVSHHLATLGKRDDGGPAELVQAGDVIGTMGGDEGDSGRVRHLHFEVWYKGHGPGGDASVDAYSAGVMDGWDRKQWHPSTL